MPRVHLGIITGWEIRATSVQPRMQVTTGEPSAPREAYRLGLINKIAADKCGRRRDAICRSFAKYPSALGAPNASSTRPPASRDLAADRRPLVHEHHRETEGAFAGNGHTFRGKRAPAVLNIDICLCVLQAHADRWIAFHFSEIAGEHASPRNGIIPTAIARCRVDPRKNPCRAGYICQDRQHFRHSREAGNQAATPRLTRSHFRPMTGASQRKSSNRIPDRPLDA